MKVYCFVILVVLVSICSSGFAEDEREAPPILPPRDHEVDKDAMPGKEEDGRERDNDREGMDQRRGEAAGQMREKLMKRRRGEEIDEDERAFVERKKDRLREVMDEERAGEGERPRRRSDPVIALIADLNVADRAALSAADALFRAGKRGDAVAAAKKVIDQTPDREAQSCARLVCGRFFQEMEQANLATEQYLQVNGKAATYALHFVLSARAREGNVEEVIQSYEKLLAVQQTALDRSRLLQSMLRWVERYPAEAEMKARVLVTIAGSVTRVEALAAQEDLKKEQTDREPGAQDALWGPRQVQDEMGPRGEGGGLGRGPDRRRKPDVGEPERRIKDLERLKAQLQTRLKEMGDGGDAEERAVLRERLDRIEKAVQEIKRSGVPRGGTMKNPGGEEEF